MSSLDDYKKQKSVEDQRRKGLLAKEVDKETGMEVNPYIPVFIAKAPWYLEKEHSGASLSHQNSKGVEKSLLDEKWYERGARMVF